MFHFIAAFSFDGVQQYSVSYTYRYAYELFRCCISHPSSNSSLAIAIKIKDHITVVLCSKKNINRIALCSFPRSVGNSQVIVDYMVSGIVSD